MDLSQRADRFEIMDTQEIPESQMRRVLSFLETTNKYFGGIAVPLRFFEAWSSSWKPGETVTILDIGTGGGEIPLALAEWARRKGLNIHVTGIDLGRDIVKIAGEKTARATNVSIQFGNFFDFVRQNKKFDYVISSLLLHHIPLRETVEALQAFDAIAARGVIVSDLLRSQSSYRAVQAISLLLGNSVVRNDGPLSVRRSFTVDELNELARSTGLSYLRAQPEPWFRVSLAGEKF